jgi:hypothetical protein
MDVNPTFIDLFCGCGGFTLWMERAGFLCGGNGDFLAIESVFCGGENEGGRWKSASNEITETLPDGTKNIRFVPVAPHQTAEYMRLLHQRYNELVREQVWEPLLLIPLYVLDFLCIHPFLDGNGHTMLEEPTPVERLFLETAKKLERINHEK